MMSSRTDYATVREAGMSFRSSFSFTILIPSKHLGLLERFHVTISQLGFDSCVVIAARYNTDGAVLDRHTLYPALHKIIHAHPALSVQIITGRKPSVKPRFVHLPAVLLDDVVSFTHGPDDDSSIAQVLMAQLAQTFELGTATPLWRLIVVSGRTVVFAFHHVIGDGQSGLAFQSVLLTVLNGSSKSLAPPENKVVISATPVLVPPVESLTDVSVSFRGFWSTIFDTFVPHSLTKGATAWTGNPVVRTPNIETVVRCWEIEAPQARELLALCRKHDTTLTGYLHTLAVGVLSKLITGSQDKRFKTLCIQVPVSLRRFTDTSPYMLCDQVSTTRSYVPLQVPTNDTASTAWFSWPAAAQFTKQLSAAVEKSREAIGTIRYLYRFGISKAYFHDALGKKRHDSLKLNNLGRFPASADGTWTIASVFWAQCDAVIGPAITLNVVGSPTGAIGVTFSWAPGAIESSFAEAFVADMKAALPSVLQSAQSS